MDFEKIGRVAMMLDYLSPRESMINLVDEGLTPERAHVIICAAIVLRG